MPTFCSLKAIELVDNGGKPKSSEAKARAFATVGKGETLAAKPEPLESRARALDTKGEGGAVEKDWQIKGSRVMKATDNQVQPTQIDGKNTFRCLEEHGAEWPTLKTQQGSEG